MKNQPVHIPGILVPLIWADMRLAVSVPGWQLRTLSISTPVRTTRSTSTLAADGDRSNALGDHFFTGETAMGELRRSVLAFDVAGNVPAGSTITGVTLTLNMSRTPSSTARTTELHKLIADWGEGTSQASGEEGMGAPATTNDATWRHRFFDTMFWTNQGGDFSTTASASQSVGADRNVQPGVRHR